MHQVRLTLPGGLLDEAGTRHRDATVRALTGREEELLAAGAAPAAILVSQLLARCTATVGTVPMTEEVARQLSVGDRQALLLAVRQATFGPRVAAVLTCPWRDCDRRMNIDFAIPDIPVTAADHWPASHRLSLTDPSGAHTDVEFRLPTGADQEAIGDLVRADPLAALEALLARCVTGVAPETLSPHDRADIEQAMRAAACGPLLSLDATCPECGRGFTVPFDIQDFFFGEVAGTPDLLLREVHYLALHYHWTEGEILDLPRDRRQRYLLMLAEEIDRRNDALV